MAKQIRIRIGDRVCWDAFNPNEFYDNRRGVVLAIKDGIATVDSDYSSKKRQVPLCKLKLCN